MNKDEIKDMIQQALWEMFKKTGIKEYNDLYQIWYEKYEDIDITGLGLRENAGRPKAADFAEIQTLKMSGLTQQAIAIKLNVSLSTVRRNW